MNTFRISYDAVDSIRDKYPNMVSVPVAAFGISHVLYEDNTYQKEIGRTVYREDKKNDTFVGCDVELILNK